MESPSRRTILKTAAVVSVTLPMIETALGGLKSAQAATPRGGGRTASAPAEEKAGWMTTKLKVADLKDNEFVVVEGHKILVTRAGKEVSAMTNVCTHRNCAMTPAAGKTTITCQCHNSAFTLDGGVSKGPATKPLQRFAIRANKDGLVEIDPGQKLAKDAKEATLTIA